MVQNNKVLTVSYGTFSCTLEGFEDSFGTMKAIAEYFRDLAADDRYFGAEPPQPDADMLARIAQREIVRQVEARTSHEGIHLRAADPAAVPAVPAETPSDSDHDSAKPASALPPQVQEQPAPLADTSHDPLHDDSATSTEAAPEIAPPAPDAGKIAAISAAIAAQSVDAEEEHHAEQEPEIAQPSAASMTTSPLAEDSSDAEEAADDRAVTEQSSAESIAAKLRRIRAVVSQTPQEDFSEDEHADSILPETSEASDLLLEGSGTADDASDDTGDGDDDDEISRVLSQLAPQVQTEASPAPVSEDPIDQDAELQADNQAEDSQPAPTGAAPQRRARIIKVKRADLEQAVASGVLEETPAAPQQAAQHQVDSSLSEEDEDDLMRELAAVEADLLAAASEPDEDSAEAGEDQEELSTIAEPRSTPNLADSDVSRLMAAADAKLGAPETASSRETYSHLRAAVAAAQADGPAAGADDSTGEKAYREDLANVVKPRRPGGRDNREPLQLKPAARPAPLKLVAEQRIDPSPAPQPDTQTDAPIRPRRISVMGEDTTVKDDEHGGFAAYARNCGAVELPDLLEAAASYMSFVEGRDHFSRPQLINAVRSSGAAEFNREDGLRSFGQLLREGKIERSDNGRFAATEEIGFRPAKRAAG